LKEKPQFLPIRSQQGTGYAEERDRREYSDWESRESGGERAAFRRKKDLAEGPWEHGAEVSTSK